jgi:hypothetical protein
LFRSKICSIFELCSFLKKIKNITKVRFFKNKKENTKKKSWKKRKRNHGKKMKNTNVPDLAGPQPNKLLGAQRVCGATLSADQLSI